MSWTSISGSWLRGILEPGLSLICPHTLWTLRAELRNWGRQWQLQELTCWAYRQYSGKWIRFLFRKELYGGPMLRLIKGMELEKPTSIPGQRLVPFEWVHLFPFSLFPLPSPSNLSPRLTWQPLHNFLILQAEVRTASPAFVQGGLLPSLIKTSQSWSDSCLISRLCLLIIMPQLNWSFGSGLEWSWNLGLYLKIPAGYFPLGFSHASSCCCFKLW